MSRVFLLSGVCFLVAGCAAGALGLGRVALAGGTRAALLEAGTVRAVAGGATAESLAAGTSSRLLIGRSALSSVDGSLGRALAELRGGRTVLTIDTGGAISSGPQAIASLRGSQLIAEGRVVGYLERGSLISSETGTAVGRLRGMIPQSGARLELSNAGITTSTRPMMVDILELSDGMYLVRLASGETAWIPVGFVTLALMGLSDQATCRTGEDRGVLVRTSGESVIFDRCEVGPEVTVLWDRDDAMVVANSEIARILYDSVALELAALDSSAPA